MRAENASLMQRLEMCQKVNEQQEKEYLALKSENDRLLAALKPVLEVDCQLDDYPTKEAYMAALEIVVSDAQRIYNGCGESEVKE